MVTIEVKNSNRVVGIRVTISCRYCIAFEVMRLFLVMSDTACYMLRILFYCNALSTLTLVTRRASSV